MYKNLFLVWFTILLKLLFLGFFFLIIICLMIVTYNFINKKEPLEYISDIIEVDLNKCKIDTSIDTHGGFLGDGRYFAKIDCSNQNNYNEFSDWKKLPLSNPLKKVMEMNICDDDGCSTVFEKYNIPKIDNGYYYFLDRHSDAKDKHNDDDLNNRYSRNFSLAIFDADSKIIYFYELDT